MAGRKLEVPRKEKIWRRVKLITALVVILTAGVLAVVYLPFPWYVHKDMSMVCFRPTGSAHEDGVIEVRGWMLCYMFKPDRFYGTVETTMGNATYKHGDYKGKVKAVFEDTLNAGMKLSKGYRRLVVESADFEGDMMSFLRYWMNKEHHPVIEGRFKSIFLENDYANLYSVSPAKTVQEAWKVVDHIKEDNPGF